ncbi:hypothetical protein F5972_07430 [Microbispora cellulosiformans]|uniref:WD40 repeat domain-containing protein n=1 Tax=Microbispora cellulosiformans TaxID=2614688 RepID=A0A5J5KB86_9ACTN|nr:PD40 domain-containing protein [Microbispora cellulosiformans]KAA9380908.1 hypothetical protein F5972_07430 [Microbispora cellulosiformans]
MNTRLLSAAVLAAALVAPATAAAPAGAAAAPKPLTGAAVYLSHGKGYPISRYEPGKGFTKLGAMPMTGQFSASPDGRRIAWITGGGAVQVSDGRTVSTAAKGAGAGAPCLTPVWSPDSRQVAFLAQGQGDAQRVVVVNADGTRRRTAGSTRGVCHLAWSANGRYLAGYAGTTEGVYRFDLSTGRSVRAKGIGLANHVQSLSPDGMKVVVAPLSRDAPGGDGSWPGGFRPAIVDIVTGKKVPIPVKGSLIGAFYLPDGRLAVRVAGRAANTLVVLDANGRQLQRLAEPAAAKRQALLQIVR